MPKGYTALLLHAHLPFVRHPDEDGVLAERWLFEGLTESYLPLIQLFESLMAEGVRFRVTISLSPTLMGMMADGLLQERYLRHLDKCLELSSKEVERTSSDPAFNELARMYKRQFESVYLTYQQYSRNPLNAFRSLRESGRAELITSAATHAYLPLVGINRPSARAQILVGLNSYGAHLGGRPAGFWLPECGYSPEIDDLLGDAGIRYTVLETHGLLYAAPRPRYGVYAPIRTPSGVAAFGRDVETSKQVWSSIEGYPGDHDYREFYRDIGHDLDYEYVRPYISTDGTRINTGIKYYRITGKTDHKQPYVPRWASEKARVHGGNFVFNRAKQIEHLASRMDKPPIVVAPYDAELFGHWWYEGPQWLKATFSRAASAGEVFEFIAPSDYLEMFPRLQPGTPCMSSWGYQGYNEMWLNGANDWVYRHLHMASRRMSELANRYREGAEPLVTRALNQAARELMLAEASDWPFIMKAGTLDQYAHWRVVLHLGRFNKLWSHIRAGDIDRGWLEWLEGQDNLFPDLDYRVYA